MKARLDTFPRKMPQKTLLETESLLQTLLTYPHALKTHTVSLSTSVVHSSHDEQTHSAHRLPLSLKPNMF